MNFLFPNLLASKSLRLLELFLPCLSPGRQRGLALVEIKRSRPSVKRGRDRHRLIPGTAKERQDSLGALSHLQGVLLKQYGGRLNASPLLSLPKQWHGPQRARLQISSVLLFFCEAIVVTEPLTTDFFFFFNQSSLSCLTLQRTRILSHYSQGNNGGDQCELSTQQSDLVLISLFPCLACFFSF